LSRLRSSRGSKSTPAATPAARPAGRRPGILVQAPKSDIFVALLGVALAAIILACLLMFIILWRYEFKANAKLAAAERGIVTPAVMPAGVASRPIVA
jgi:hypothetical protein